MAPSGTTGGRVGDEQPKSQRAAKRKLACGFIAYSLNRFSLEQRCGLSNLTHLSKQLQSRRPDAFLELLLERRILAERFKNAKHQKILEASASGGKGFEEVVGSLP